MKRKLKKNLNTEDLAGMVQRGFEEMSTRFDRVEYRLQRVEQHLEKFEKIILADYGRRIKRLEADIDYLKDALAIK